MKVKFYYCSLTKFIGRLEKFSDELDPARLNLSSYIEGQIEYNYELYKRMVSGEIIVYENYYDKKTKAIIGPEKIISPKQIKQLSLLL